MAQEDFFYLNSNVVNCQETQGMTWQSIEQQARDLSKYSSSVLTYSTTFQKEQAAAATTVLMYVQYVWFHFYKDIYPR